MTDRIALVWHRRDLRVHDNPALNRAAVENTRVLGVFVVDPAIFDNPDTAPARVYYLRESVLELQRSYAERGGLLVVRLGEPAAVLAELATAVGATAVHFNDDIEPYARERDARVGAVLTASQVAVHAHPEILLHPADEVRTQQGQPYTVFTPFWRNWSVKPKPKPCEAPERLQSPACDPGHFPELAELGRPFAGALLVRPGERAAREQLDAVIAGILYRYGGERDLPAVAATSQMGAHLKFGTVGIREVWLRTQQAWKAATSDAARASIAVYQQELGWREFYKYVLSHFPHVAEGPFRREFERFQWDDDEERFVRWCRGETGYPLVDAAMRQLNTVSWMHNRLRMVVASFLTKDLLIDYRRGERYFMQKLVDGDLSANNGGWQWAASVGTDPKPLRIFNPSTQAERYDPEARYIRLWLPELAPVDTRALLNVERFTPLERSRYGYPLPLVDHARQQQRFKERYRTLKDAQSADGS
jgi:deoxyribodipyrimidine photo-lyase